MLHACQIERGFLMHTTGIQEDQGQFSKDIVGNIVAEYVYMASVLSKRQWNNVKTLCGAHIVEQKPNLKVRSTQVNRRALYEPSSPTKESESD